MKKILLSLAVLLVVNSLGFNVMAEETEISFTLDEIVVTASKYQEKLSETPVSVEVIDEEEIKQKNAQNVADLLRDIAGVDINDYGGLVGSKKISIRGANPKHVLVLIDGQEMNNPLDGAVDLSQLSIEQIERIEVLRGSASVMYGANALGGVVNIITKDATEESKTIVKLGYGSYDSQTYNLIHRGKVERLGYNLSISKKKSDGDRDNSGLDQQNIFAKFSLDLSDYSDITLSLQDINSDKEQPGSIIDPRPDAKQKDSDTNINLQWKRQTESSDMKISFYNNNHDMIYDDPDDSWSPHNENYSKKKGIEFNTTNYYQNHSLIYGLQLEEERLKGSTVGKQNNLNRVVFVQDDWQVNKPLKFTVGARYDQYESYDSNFSPRIATVYTINSKVNIHASVEEAYVTPTLSDLAYAGKEGIDPESAVVYETGVRFRDKGIKGELNYFKKDIDDLISWDGETEKTYNIDSVKVSGVELILSKELLRNLTAEFNYTYLDARNNQTDKRLDYKPYHKANFNLNYTDKELSFSINNQFIGQRTGKHWYPDYSSASTTMDRCIITNIKIGRKVSNDIEVSLDINNLFDKEYEIIEDYPMPERNYMLKISTKF